MNKMLPNMHFDDTGANSVGTLYNGPFTGPDTCEETNLTYGEISESVELADAIAALSTGAVPTEQHAYAIYKNDLSHQVAILKSSAIRPDYQGRKVTPLKFKPGDKIFVRGVQLSNTGAAAEATVLDLTWKHA